MNVLGFLYFIVGLAGVIVGVVNVIIAERTRRLSAFRLAWDIRNFREERERGLSNEWEKIIVVVSVHVSESNA